MKWSAILVFASIAHGADFWQVKDPDVWTEKEVAQIRTKSPWAHP